MTFLGALVCIWSAPLGSCLNTWYLVGDAGLDSCSNFSSWRLIGGTVLLGVDLQRFIAQPHFMFADCFLSADQCKQQSHGPVDIPSSLVSQKKVLLLLAYLGIGTLL